MFKKLKVNARLTRPTFGDGREVMELSIEDETSGLLIVELHLSAEQFMDFMSNRHASNIACELNDNPDIGKKRVHKVVKEVFDIKGASYNERAEMFKDFLAAVEAKHPGWKPNDRSFNSKRFDYVTNEYEVGLVTYQEVQGD